jgi:arylformamidase
VSEIAIKGTRIIDLSQTVEPDIPVPVGFPSPKLDVFLSQEKGDVANVEILTMSVHSGTHFDAPYHFFSELQRTDELPPDCLIGPGVVVDMTNKQGSVAIEANEFQEWEAAKGETIQSGDIVLLHTNHSAHWRLGTDASGYWQNGWPHMARSAVDYLASKPIRAIGVESFDPDWVDLDDLSSAEFPSHRTFLPQGILVIENLTNLDQIPGSRCQVIALPLKIKGASGSPVRVIAVV